LKNSARYWVSVRQWQLYFPSRVGKTRKVFERKGFETISLQDGDIPNYRKTASSLPQEQRLELERLTRHAFVSTINSWTELGDHILKDDDEALALLKIHKFVIVGDQ
jgi:hypothetical protein